MVVSLNSRLESNKEEDDDEDRSQVNSHGARPVHLIITMIKWMRTSRLSIQNTLSQSKSTGMTGMVDEAASALITKVWNPSFSSESPATLASPDTLCPVQRETALSTTYWSESTYSSILTPIHSAH